MIRFDNRDHVRKIKKAYAKKNHEILVLRASKYGPMWYKNNKKKHNLNQKLRRKGIRVSNLVSKKLVPCRELICHNCGEKFLTKDTKSNTHPLLCGICLRVKIALSKKEYVEKNHDKLISSAREYYRKKEGFYTYKYRARVSVKLNEQQHKALWELARKSNKSLSALATEAILQLLGEKK